MQRPLRLTISWIKCDVTTTMMLGGLEQWGRFGGVGYFDSDFLHFFILAAFLVPLQMEKSRIIKGEKV